MVKGLLFSQQVASPNLAVSSILLISTTTGAVKQMLHLPYQLCPPLPHQETLKTYAGG